MNEDYFKQENDLTKKSFNLDVILEFQLKHDVQVIRGEDYQYMCYIDKVSHGSSLTPLHALVYGINTYLDINPEEREEELYDPYCKVCSGCGEEGCCSPLKCDQSPDGKYCSNYLKDLKFAYLMYDDIFGLITDEEDKKKVDELIDKNIKLIYK